MNEWIYVSVLILFVIVLYIARRHLKLSHYRPYIIDVDGVKVEILWNEHELWRWGVPGYACAGGRGYNTKESCESACRYWYKTHNESGIFVGE